MSVQTKIMIRATLGLLPININPYFSVAMYFCIKHILGVCIFNGYRQYEVWINKLATQLMFAL